MDNNFASIDENFSFRDFLSQVTPQSATLSSEELVNYYQRYQTITFFDLAHQKIIIDAEHQLPEKMALSIKAMVVQVDKGDMVVGFADPFDRDAIAAAESILHAYIKPVMVKTQNLMHILRLTFRKVKAIQSYADSIAVHEEMLDSIEIIKSEEDSHISVLAKLIIRDAYEMEASDIHIEVTDEVFKIRLRVDGTLQEYPIYNHSISDHLVRYLKLLADIDITESLRPTEGKKVTVMIDEKEVNLRLSFLPTYYGQSIVIRILADAASYVLQEKIHHTDYLQSIREYLTKNCGLFLISGPTGSGKTTTLYSALQEVNRPDIKIITLEDPIEARIPEIGRAHV